MFNMNTGKVGIGTEIPTTNLHVLSSDSGFIDTVAIFLLWFFSSSWYKFHYQLKLVLVFAKNSNTLGLIGAQNM